MRKMASLLFIILIASAFNAAVAAGDALLPLFGELYTSPLFAPQSDLFQCNVTNISTSTITVGMTIYDSTGAIVDQLLNVSLTANQTEFLAISTDGLNLFHCKFSTLNKSKIRANSFVRITFGGERISATSEAR